MSASEKDRRRLGKRIKSLRTARGLSQDRLAGDAYTSAYVSLVEKGERYPSRDALDHFAVQLGIATEQLLSGRDPNEDVRLEIEIQQATARIHAGEAPAAQKELVPLRARAVRLGHERAIVRADEALGLAAYRQGNYSGALEAYARAESLIPADDPEARTTAVVGIARCEFVQGSPRDAIYRLEVHLRDLERSPAPDPTALLQTYSAMIPPLFESGEINRAKEVASEGVRLAPDVGDPEQLACLYMNRAGLLITQGKRRDALASYALAEDQFQQLGWHSEIVKVSIARAVALTEEGLDDEAEEVLRKALGAVEDLPPIDEARALVLLSGILRRREEPDEALKVIRRALRLTGSQPNEAAQAHLSAGWALLDLRDEDAALTEWKKAMRLFKKTGNHEETAKTARMIGDHFAASGDKDAAIMIFRDGLDALEELH